MKRKSRQSAEETLRRFFANAKNSDSVSVIDIFKATKRTPEKNGGNMSWLSNHMSTLRYYGLIAPVYTYHDRKRLEKIKLTSEGVRTLRRNGDAEDPTRTRQPLLVEGVQKSNQEEALLTQVMKLVAKLGEENPEFEVTFDVKLKNKS